MNDPVAEIIANNLLTAVQSVTTVNGYNYTLTASRPTKAGIQRVHLNAYLQQDDPKETPDAPYYTQELVRPFQLDVIIAPSDTDQTPLDTFINRIVADVQKAVMTDRQRGGNAIDTLPVPERTWVQVGLEGITLQVVHEVHYRTDIANQYTNAK